MKIADEFKIKYVDNILSEYTELSKHIDNMIKLLDNIENNNFQNITEALYWPPIALSKTLYELVKNKFSDKIILNIKYDYCKNFVLVFKFDDVYLMLKMRKEELLITKDKTKIIQELLFIFQKLQKQYNGLKLPNNISIDSLCSIIDKTINPN